MTELNTLDTLDIILFKGDSVISRLIEFFGECKYSHVGVVLKDPKYIDPSMEDGLYLFESSYNDIVDTEDHRIKIGIQLHRLEDILKECPKDSVYVRHVDCVRDESFYKKLKEVHDETKNKPYDLNPFDWIVAKYNLDVGISPDPRYKQTKEFWCSAFVCYLFHELGLVKKEVNWSIVSPHYFSEKGRLEFFCNVTREEKLY